MISGIKVLVLTDRYPPYSEGGAEISLHLILKPLVDAGNVINVVTLSENISRVERTRYEGIEVFRIPYSSEWPTSRWENRLLMRRRPRSVWKILSYLKSTFDYVRKSRGETSFFNRVRYLLFFRRLRDARMTRHAPMRDREISDVPLTLEILERLEAELKPDLVHADNFRSILLASRAKFSVPTVAQVRDNRFHCVHRSQPMNIERVICTTCSLNCISDAPPKLIPILSHVMESDRDFRQAALRKADRVVVTSRFLYDQVSNIVDQRKITLVRNPEGEAHLADVAEALSQASPPEILIVGMLNENKGQLQILDWLELLNDQLNDFRIVIAGRGERLERMLRRGLSAEGWSDRVVFTGYLNRTELYRAYARATVVACPNVWPEPFGRVPLEAGISRRPIVAYAVGGVAENVVHEETGLLVPPGDIHSFVNSLVRVIKDPLLAQMLGLNARRHIAKNFSIGDSVKALADCWSEVVDGRRD